jgi:hypothetical protein
LVHVSGSVRGTKCGLDVGTCIEKRDGGTFQTSTLNQSKEGYQTEGQVRHDSRGVRQKKKVVFNGRPTPTRRETQRAMQTMASAKTRTKTFAHT